MALVDWMLREDRKMFEKKEILEKYCELWEGKRKTLQMDQLMKILEKFKMWNVVVRDRKGFEHYLKFDMNTTVVTHVKREEVSRDEPEEKELQEGRGRASDSQE